MTFKPCAVIPSRNHYRDIGHVVAALRDLDLPVYVVDDCSDEPARVAIHDLHDPDNLVTVLRLDANQGKGGAVCHGLRAAAAGDFTHVLQIDADGQHDLSALPRLLSLAREHPDALVSGRPVYDESIGTGRKIARWITHVWVWIETLSFRITDTMCGFRVYPLGPAIKVINEERVGSRMDFDIGIMVHLYWRGVDVIPLPVRVIYPPENISNFHALKDNWRITCMHTRLVLTMLLRLPRILRNRPARAEPSLHWSALAERGADWGLRLSAMAHRLFGRTGCLFILAPVVFYFFITGTEQRRGSRQFLERALARTAVPRSPTWFDGYRHFMSFAGRAVDNLAAWSGRISPDVVSVANDSTFRKAKESPEGALFIVSHLGNVEITRALLDDATRARLTILVHTKDAAHYNDVLRRYNPASALNALQVTDIGPDTTIQLQERIDRGDWVFIAGDRTPVGSQDRTVSADFLGEEAPFAQGPYILASLLNCPVYFMVCLRVGRGYELYVEEFSDGVTLPRGDREGALRRHAQHFADRLAYYVLKDPFQWYNFFNFWETSPKREQR